MVIFTNISRTRQDHGGKGRAGINVDIKSNLNNDPSPAWPRAAAGVTPAVVRLSVSRLSDGIN